MKRISTVYLKDIFDAIDDYAFIKLLSVLQFEICL